VQYDERANGQRVDAKVGEEFEIVLPEARTAGYRWAIVEKGEPSLQLLEDTSQSNVAGVGGAGHHRWRFRGAAAGECEIKLQYARCWQEPAEPARTFILKVRVKL
jgi:predicted secreted protein